MCVRRSSQGLHLLLVSMSPCTAAQLAYSELPLAIPECGLKKRSKGGGGVTRLNATAALIRALIPNSGPSLNNLLTALFIMIRVTLVVLIVLLRTVIAVTPPHDEFSLVSDAAQISNASLVGEFAPSPNFIIAAEMLQGTGSNRWHIREMFKRQTNSLQTCPIFEVGATTSYCSRTQTCCATGCCTVTSGNCCGTGCCAYPATCTGGTACAWRT
jgi:hypothetical protein